MKVSFVTVLAATVAVCLAVPSWAADDGPTQSGKRKTMADYSRDRLESGKYDEVHSRAGNGPAEGTMAPDFSLTPLKFYEFGIDEEAITAENAGDLYKPVRLSSFRGEKPVVLIFGSYT